MDILKGVNLQVEQGQVYGLLGRNGAGKTTTLRCALGFQPFHSGSAEIFGVPAQELHHVSQQLGVALDPPGMDDTLTVRQNLELARIRSGLREGRGVDEALALVGLSHRADNAGDKLSHGQSRRAAVARALLGRPSLLLLDEPLSGLDPEGVEVLLALFRRLADEEGVTVLLSSHHLREVQHVCDRVGMIEQGVTVLEGRVDSLLQEAGDGLRLECKDLDRAEALLETTTGVRDVQRQKGSVLRAQVDSTFQANPLIHTLVQADVGLSDFTRDRANLVDVFQRAVAKAVQA